MRKILFLDVDGVLNSRDSTNFKNNLWPVNDYMCWLVLKIQLDTDCAIVVSSSWRHHPDGLELIRKKFLNVIDITPKINQSRGQEIQAWLETHTVDRYAILDDDSDMLKEQLPNFFQTTFETGLTEEIAKAVTEHLNA